MERHRGLAPKPEEEQAGGARHEQHQDEGPVQPVLRPPGPLLDVDGTEDAVVAAVGLRGEDHQQIGGELQRRVLVGRSR